MKESGDFFAKGKWEMAGEAMDGRKIFTATKKWGR